jgi:predicted dehydrogenase
MMKDSLKKISRRQFIETVSVTGAAGFMIMQPGTVRGSAANSALRIGQVGCGGRGGAVATDFLKHTNTRMVALGDLFPDQLEKARENYGKIAKDKGQPIVDSKFMFKGPMAYKEIANCKEIDALLITTPDYFHAEHVEAAVAAGKHIYCEKPAGVDVAGAKRFIEIGKKVEGKLSLDIGFQVRSAPPIAEMARRIKAGAIGKIGSASTYYHATSINYPPRGNVSALELRLRNWYWDKVLSGDIIVDQNLHVIDLVTWILGAPPVKAVGTGGRNLRNDPGDCWDHFDVIYTYPGDVHVSLNSIQYGTDSNMWDVAERFFGSKGAAEAHYSGPVRIYGEQPWQWTDPAQAAQAEGAKKFSTTGEFTDNLAQATPEKVKGFYESVVSGKFHNQAKEGAYSVLAAVLGREAAYKGREMTWDELLRSNQTYDAGIDWSKL